MIHKIEGGGMTVWTGDKGYEQYLKVRDKAIDDLVNEVVNDLMKINIEKQIKKAKKEDEVHNAT